MGRIKLAQVALAAGVSTSTASMALRDDPRVAQKTRTKVREVAVQLGYQPDAAARTLREGTVPLVGVLLDANDRSSTGVTRTLFWALFVEAITTELSRHGVAVVCVESRAVQSLWKLPLQGLVLACSNPGDVELPANPPFGLMLASRASSELPNLTTCEHNFAQMASDAVCHLYERGAQRVAMLDPGVHLDVIGDMTDAYRANCQERGIQPTFIPWEADGLPVALQQALSKGTDAIFAPWGPTAAILAAASELGVSIPGDLQLVVVAEGIVESATTPTVTTVSYDADSSARIIAETIVHSLAGDGGGPQTLPHKLTPRASTAKN